MECFHIPEKGLLIVVSAEVDQVPNKIDDQIMLNVDSCTLVGLIKFCNLSLKLNVSSNL